MSEVLYGVWNSYPFSETGERERIVRQGQSGWLVIFQIAAIYSAIELIGEIGTLTKLYKQPSTFTSTAIALTPGLLYYSKTRAEKADKNGWQNRLLTHMQNHVSSACQVTCAVHALTLIGAGKIWRGGAALAVLAFIQGEKALPHALRENIHLGLFVATNGARLYLGKWNHRLLAVAQIGLNWRMTSENARKERPVSPPIDITRPAGLTGLEIEPWHMEVYQDFVVPDPPDVDLAEYGDLFQKIDWTDAAVTQQLHRELSSDPRWTKNPQDVSEEAYVKQGMANFVKSLTNRTISVGELSSFDPITKKAKHLLATLKELEAKDRTGTLINLAIGSYYCASGFNREVHLAYDAHCAEAPEDLFIQLNRSFSRFRGQLLDDFLRDVEEKMPPGMRIVYQSTDDHWHNIVQGLLQEKFGLPDQALTKEDALAAKDVERALLGVMYRPLFHLHFSQHYTPEALVEQFKTAISIKNTRIVQGKAVYEVSPYLVIRWFAERIQNTGLTLDDCYDEEGLPKEGYLTLILLDLGFLRKRESTSLR